MDNDLGIGVGTESKTMANLLVFKRLEVFYYAVVDDSDTLSRDMWMGIVF